MAHILWMGFGLDSGVPDGNTRKLIFDDSAFFSTSIAYL